MIFYTCNFDLALLIVQHIAYIVCRLSRSDVSAKRWLCFLFQIVQGNVGIFHSDCRGNLLI